MDIIDEIYRAYPYASNKTKGDAFRNNKFNEYRGMLEGQLGGLSGIDATWLIWIKAINNDSNSICNSIKIVIIHLPSLQRYVGSRYHEYDDWLQCDSGGVPSSYNFIVPWAELYKASIPYTEIDVPSNIVHKFQYNVNHGPNEKGEKSERLVNDRDMKHHILLAINELKYKNCLIDNVVLTPYGDTDKRNQYSHGDGVIYYKDEHYEVKTSVKRFNHFHYKVASLKRKQIMQAV